MAPSVVVNNGTGTFGIGSVRFLPGETECDDAVILEHLAQDAPDWIMVRYADEQLSELEPESEPEPEPESEPEPEPESEPELGASGPLTAEELLARGSNPPDTPGPGDQPAPAEDAPSPEPEPAGFPCRESECDRVFTTENGRATHERSKHGDQ